MTNHTTNYMYLEQILAARQTGILHPSTPLVLPLQIFTPRYRLRGRWPHFRLGSYPFGTDTISSHLP